MFRVHHGLQDFTDVQDVHEAVMVAARLLASGKTNVLITQPSAEVTGYTDYYDQPSDRIATLVLEISIGSELAAQSV